MQYRSKPKFCFSSILCKDQLQRSSLLTLEPEKCCHSSLSITLCLNVVKPCLKRSHKLALLEEITDVLYSTYFDQSNCWYLFLANMYYKYRCNFHTIVCFDTICKQKYWIDQRVVMHLSFNRHQSNNI